MNIFRHLRTLHAARIFFLTVVLIASYAHALTPLWFSDRTINTIYSKWNDGTGGSNGVTYLRLSGGAVCHIVPKDEHLVGLIMMMRAQGLSGQFVCDRNTTLGLDGMTSYRLHRVRF